MTINKPLFDWKTFSHKLTKLIKYASSSTIVPIKDSRWEEVIFHVLKGMGEKYQGGDPKWDVGSHAPGADLWVDSLSISAKSGTIKNDILCISSYRLTRFPDLESMISFIDGGGKNFDVYLCCVLVKNKDESRTYKILVISSEIINAKNLKWEDEVSSKDKITHKGFVGYDDNNVVLKIVKNMSNQLWIYIPISLCTLIAEINIPKNDLGLSLSEVAKK